MVDVVNKWLRAIHNNDRIFKRAIVENQEAILDLNVAQLRSGKDSFGRLLDEYASDDYARYKQAIGSQAPFGIADLILEGDFTGAFILLDRGTAFFIESEDEKSNRLVSKYGEGIYGLTDEHLEQVAPDIAESYINNFRNELL